jgi:HD superfamily phosphodiesterase
MVERMANRTETELAWAVRSATELLAPLEARWRHTWQVVERAGSFRDVLDSDELGVLLAAAYLHDVGYAPELATAGFHPLDGARFVRNAGHERLAGLVAHHSASDAEAEERGFAEALDAFPREDSLVARALTYCDLTIGPDGEDVDLPARLTELEGRLGENDPAMRAVRREAARLAAVVADMEGLLAGSR